MRIQNLILGKILNKEAQKSILGGKGVDKSLDPASGKGDASYGREYEEYGVCIENGVFIRVLCSLKCSDGTDPICAF